VIVRDGRVLMAESGLSEAQFFAKFGFVLLKHTTSMQPHEWEDDAKVQTVYDAEVEALVKGPLGLPNAIYGSTGRIMVRGPPLPGAPNTRKPLNFYGIGIHGDYGLGVGQYTERCRMTGEEQLDWKAADAFDATIGQAHVAGYNRINLWRPIKPMREPLKHKPMAFCDPNTVAAEDVVLYRSLNTPYGGVAGRLKFNPKHEWYYFPDMTTDEVVVFKVYEHWKADPGANLRQFPAVFHTAFDDPTMNKASETRNSTEYRPFIFHPQSR